MIAFFKRVLLGKLPKWDDYPTMYSFIYIQVKKWPSIPRKSDESRWTNNWHKYMDSPPKKIYILLVCGGIVYINYMQSIQGWHKSICLSLLVNISATIVCDFFASAPCPHHGLFVQHISCRSPTTKVRSDPGNATSNSANLLPMLLQTKVKLWRPAGHVALSTLWLKHQPRVKHWMPAGHVTLSRLWLKSNPKVKLWRPAGHETLSRLWLKKCPRVRLWRPAGHEKLSRLRLKFVPKVKLWRPAGHITLSRFSFKSSPKVKLWRPAGHETLSRLRLKSCPKVKLWRPACHETLSRLWLKSCPKVKLCRPSGHVTLSRLWLSPVSKSQTLKACWPCHLV